MSHRDATSVDIGLERSVSFAPPAPLLAADSGFNHAHLDTSAGPRRSAFGAPSLVRRGELEAVHQYPIQSSKVQRPPLHDETLARERLLDWLNVKVHHRIVFVVAEAGYGKTTLLSDFSRRSRLRTLWYRLDEEDRNWIAFLNYLVAAGRELDPGFAPATAGLLREMDGPGPTREAVTETFLREFQALGDRGAVLVLDDYHLVDDAPDVRQIVGELLARAPERISFVLASRRMPSVRVARLRALGEVAELATDDLRFNQVETERLFREIYRRPLEPDVLTDLSARTEGWAASLQLVQAAIRDRTSAEARIFIRSLSGAEGELYDYLAEEVVGDLPEDLQDFLMRTSILLSVDPDLVRLITGRDGGTCQRLLSQAERLGLLARRAEMAGSTRGYHPLVREFLQDRLRRDRGTRFIEALHLRVADDVAARDWRLACHHYAAAGHQDRVRDVIERSVGEIMGAGQFEIAASYLEQLPEVTGNGSAYLDVIMSRADVSAGRHEGALSRAQVAVQKAPNSELAAANLLSLQISLGDLEAGHHLATALAATSKDPILKEIAAASRQMKALSLDGNLSEFVTRVTRMAEMQRAAGYRHYEGVSLLNAAMVLRAQGLANRCLAQATASLDALSASSAGHEAMSARFVRSWALAHVGRWDEAIAAIGRRDEIAAPSLNGEGHIEAATLHLWYGDLGQAQEFVHDLAPIGAAHAYRREMWRILDLELALRENDMRRAQASARRVQLDDVNPEPGFKAHQLAVTAYAALVGREPSAATQVAAAIRFAERQDAGLWVNYGRVLKACASDPTAFSREILRATEGDPAYLSILAEIVVSRLGDADQAASSAIESEAVRRPQRWRSALRTAVDDPASPHRWRAARLLDLIGEAEDIPRLRSVARLPRARLADRALGKNLARRLAPIVEIEDQGRVALRVGEQAIEGTAIRRKVLGLLCFLVSQPGFSATRDQVLDALWPDLDPAVALNSLNQTVYFLRRVFEPAYQEEVSPDYLHHDTNLIWLDTRLVRARSARCWELVRESSAGDPLPVGRLSETYIGRFALDFAYEEWSMPYRDSLHAAYLQVMENAVAADLEMGHYERGIGLARRAIGIDPEAEQLEVSLLRLYRQSGAHSAAAEQYAHYAHTMRTGLGVEPPPLEAL